MLTGPAGSFESLTTKRTYLYMQKENYKPYYKVQPKNPIFFQTIYIYLDVRCL